MKKVLVLIATALMLVSYTADAKKTANSELKVMSYNIRLGVGKDGSNSWEFRAPATIEMISVQRPDVFGVQEAYDFQIDYVSQNCKEYGVVGVGRDDGVKKGEHMSVFWNKRTVKLIKWGTFWLSETPEVPSKGWDADCKRTTTWALMKDKKTGKKFYFVNTHLDHIGAKAQKNGLKLIVDRIDSINPEGYPMVLTGDFNITPDHTALLDLEAKMQCTRTIAPVTDDMNTCNGWSDKKTRLIIDYIYVSGFQSCLEYKTVTDKYAGIPFISDHYPIISRLVL